MNKTFLEQVKDLFRGESAIKVGVVASRVGPLDYYGTMQARGLELGIEYATAGSYKVAERPIELLVEEDASDPATGGQKARALIEEQGVQILQGCTSPRTRRISRPTYKRYGTSSPTCWCSPGRGVVTGSFLAPCAIWESLI